MFKDFPKNHITNASVQKDPREVFMSASAISGVPIYFSDYAYDMNNQICKGDYAVYVCGIYVLGNKGDEDLQRDIHKFWAAYMKLRGR